MTSSRVNVKQVSELTISVRQVCEKHKACHEVRTRKINALLENFQRYICNLLLINNVCKYVREKKK